MCATSGGLSQIEASKRIKSALKLFDKFRKSFRFAECWFALVQGKYFWLKKKFAKARKCWEMAVAVGMVLKY